MCLQGHLRGTAPASNKAPFEEMLQRWQAVDNTTFALSGPRFEPWKSDSRDKRITARPTSRFIYQNIYYWRFKVRLKWATKILYVIKSSFSYFALLSFASCVKRVNKICIGKELRMSYLRKLRQKWKKCGDIQIQGEGAPHPYMQKAREMTCGLIADDDAILRLCKSLKQFCFIERIWESVGKIDMSFIQLKRCW